MILLIGAPSRKRPLNFGKMEGLFLGVPIRRIITFLGGLGVWCVEFVGLVLGFRV